MVRLKDYDGTRESVGLGLFQFLMVRLKVIMLLRRLTITFVSIPYGTIKSLSRDYGSDRSSIVSIPYGTIKSS